MLFIAAEKDDLAIPSCKSHNAVAQKGAGIKHYRGNRQPVSIRCAIAHQRDASAFRRFPGSQRLTRQWRVASFRRKSGLSGKAGRAFFGRNNPHHMLASPPQNRPRFSPPMPRHCFTNSAYGGKKRMHKSSTTALMPITKGYPYSQRSSGINMKFMPYQPVISDSGKKTVVTTVNVFITRFCSIATCD